MKVTLSWLKSFVDFNWSPDQLAERLTMLGLEVEGIQKLGGEFEGVVVAQILAADKHPNADKLSLCRVTDGVGERQIVCGARNFKVGDKVPLALPGCTLPTPAGSPPFTIKVGKIRGVESQGMMCSPKELGLAEDADGLLILPENAQVGQTFAAHLGRAGTDVVFDLEVTPNRPDLNSAIGIAREIAALTGNPLRLPETSFPESPHPAAGALAVRISNPDLCPRYTARVIRGVTIGASPDWLRVLLEKLGLRSINNVVDVTNYVMMECGQPLHAFDYHLVSGTPLPTIIVRTAAEGERFITLDGKERQLNSSSLLIADPARGIALAGVMGGQNTEIQSQTRDVLIESACFKAQNIRATSKRLELRTDASFRFERGADVDLCDWASRRAARLILEVAGGQAASGAVDAYPQPESPRTISFRTEKTARLLGLEIQPATQLDYLRRLGLTVSQPAPSLPASVTVPSFRIDLKGEADLIEEVARLHGIEKIPTSHPRSALGVHPFDGIYDAIARARQILIALGFHECQGQTLISDSALDDPARPAIRLENPLSSDMSVLRPSLLPGLIHAMHHNLSRKNTDVALFEIGKVFNQDINPEELRLAIAATGHRLPEFWSGSERESKWSILDLKGVAESFLEEFGVRGATYAKREPHAPFYLECASIHLGKNLLGEIGQLSPAQARNYDLRDAVVLAEFHMDLLLRLRNSRTSYKPLLMFPSIRRDVAMFVSESVSHEAVLEAIRQAKPQFLERISLFDVFRGTNVPEGQKSMAYALTYRHADRTLTDAEVNAEHLKVLTKLPSSIGAVLRDAAG